MSYNRKTSTPVWPSVAELLRKARTEQEVEDMLVDAVLSAKEAAPATKRRWRKLAERVKGALRMKALQPPALVGLDGKELR